MGSAWEEPRNPLKFSGDIGVDDGMVRSVTLLPCDSRGWECRWCHAFGDVLMAEQMSGQMREIREISDQSDFGNESINVRSQTAFPSSLDIVDFFCAQNHEYVQSIAYGSRASTRHWTPGPARGAVKAPFLHQ